MKNDRCLLAALFLAPVLNASAQTPLTTVRVVDGLQYPTFATAPAGDSQRLFVTELTTGHVRVVDGGSLLPVPFLDVPAASGIALGLFYSMAFHPDYAQNGYVYVYYRAAAGGAHLERYTVSASDPNRADPASRVTILTTTLPASSHSGHGPVFGPDGMLYVALGDGSSGADPTCEAQNPGTLFGNLLRIDVDGGSPYAVPPDNPFVGVPGYLPEIWATGFRNPWRIAFDRATDELYVADVGQATREELDVLAPGVGGQNFGWSVEEGSQPFAHACPPGTPAPGDPAYTRPVHEYDHSLGDCSITGGFVYRGAAIPDLSGTYFFADFCSHRIGSLRYVNGAVTDLRDRTAELQPAMSGPLESIVSFAEDGVGELYVIDHGDGEIFKIVSACVAEVYCSSNPNSTSAAATVSASGSNSVGANALSLSTVDVPQFEFGYYLMSTTRDQIPLTGSQGDLCLGQPLVRFVGDVLNSGAQGRLDFTPDLTALPQGTVVQAGDTWHFQSWFRDHVPALTSNTSNGVSITFCP
ncbi:MAG: PQQ-dependent sugar dehydrogenase [bacterium]|nr:PQQ-dependent sugar dehydrogenase [bacterium]